ncbi:MAG TPA: 3-deoxy-7-phosphoheptulonate synthase, partial [Ruminococcaceae bacterium]|nr:3-deoxy-7-phosphoheptulonate synthase [Oscillospiraceae bacterium]
PSAALSDGAQSLTPAQFDNIMKQLKMQLEFEEKSISLV